MTRTTQPSGEEQALGAAFGWLGAGMLVVGLQPAAWAVYLRSRDQHEPTD